MALIGGLEVTLNNALTSLQVNQQQLTVLSNNIANANTVNYSRETAPQQAVFLDGQGDGVSIQDVVRQVDQYLTQAVRSQNSTVGQTGTLNSYNTNIQQLLGQPGNNNSLDTFTSDFFNNLQSLAQTPANTALQQAAVNSGVTLASQTQQLAQGLQGLQYQADQDITTAVGNINNDLKNLEQINDNIGTAKSLGQSVAGLQDQQDALLKDLAQYIPIQTFTNSDGSVNATTSGGITILSKGDSYQLSYNPVGSVTTFANNGTMAPMLVTQTNSNGVELSNPVQLVSGGTVSQVTTPLTDGKMFALLQMRDQQLPAILSQLDNFAATLRTQVNAVQNSGTGFPGANSYTGDRSVNAGDFSQWAGSVQIAVLGSNGQPVTSPYADEPNGVPPLTLNLSTMDTGSGPGNPSVQGIINAINQYYGPPQNKAEVSNLNNIQLVSDSSSLPGSPAQLNFDFNLNNISANPANFYVTNVAVTDSSGNPVTTLPTPTPNVALAAVNTYATTAGSSVVTINTAGSNNGLSNGETVFLSDPGGAINGIPESGMTGFFTISNVTATSFQITASAPASVSGNASVAGQTATPPYAQAPAGQSTRTSSDGIISASLATNSASPYYDVTATVAVDDGKGDGPQTAEITYRINNQQTNIFGQPFSAIAVSGNGTLVQPDTNQPLATATLVDANGNPLPASANGQYTTAQNGYLEIKAAGSTNVIAINSMNSAQLGQPNTLPPQPGTNLGFSGYFGLNDFFTPNQLTATGDTVAGSAANLQVEQRFQNDPSLLALGQLTQSPQSSNPNAPPNYTYETSVGDNSIVNAMANLGSVSFNFAAAGGLGETQQTFNGYAAQIIGAVSTSAANAQTNDTNANTLLNGYEQQASSVSGVNLDTELANTVIYQNAYAASARIVTVVSTLFDALLQSVGT